MNSLIVRLRLTKPDIMFISSIYIVIARNKMTKQSFLKYLSL